jgi:uncharacterized protein
MPAPGVQDGGVTGKTVVSLIPFPHNRAMRPSEALALHRARIREIALSHRVRDVRVFGSAASGADTPESDLDLLVEPTPQTTLLDIGAIRFELKALLGIDADVLTPNALPDKFRVKVLREARSV